MKRLPTREQFEAIIARCVICNVVTLEAAQAIHALYVRLEQLERMVEEGIDAQIRDAD